MVNVVLQTSNIIKTKVSKNDAVGKGWHVYFIWLFPSFCSLHIFASIAIHLFYIVPFCFYLNVFCFVYLKLPTFQWSQTFWNRLFVQCVTSVWKRIVFIWITIRILLLPLNIRCLTFLINNNPPQIVSNKKHLCATDSNKYILIYLPGLKLYDSDVHRPC